jgi:hypothetical protein
MFFEKIGRTELFFAVNQQWAHLAITEMLLVECWLARFK